MGEKGEAGHGQLLVSFGDGEVNRPFDQAFGPGHDP
jgi:hypothetical protein